MGKTTRQMLRRSHLVGLLIGGVSGPGAAVSGAVHRGSRRLSERLDDGRRSGEGRLVGDVGIEPTTSPV